MQLKPVVDVYILINGQRQVLYHYEHPNFKFVEGSKHPKWLPIRLEVPTRTMPATKKWIEDGFAKSVKLIKKNAHGKELQSWHLINVTIKDQTIEKSRIIDNNVIVLIVEFETIRSG